MKKSIKRYIVTLGHSASAALLPADDLTDSNRFLCSVSAADGAYEAGSCWVWEIPESNR